jgi:hypothetical protein
MSCGELAEMPSNDGLRARRFRRQSAGHVISNGGKPNVALVFKNRPLAQGVFDGLKPKRSAMSECGKAIFPEYLSRENDSSK